MNPFKRLGKQPVKEEETLKLLCFILDDTAGFYISVPNTATVLGLAELIHKTRAAGIRNTTVEKLSLLKVGAPCVVGDCLPELLVPQVEIDTRPLHGDFSQVGGYPSIPLYDTDQPVSDVWESRPPPNHLHVLVKLPPQVGEWNPFFLSVSGV
jgi:hypothetical protein